MAKKKRRIFIVFIALFGLFLFVGYKYLQYRDHVSAIAATLKWSRLAPFPESAQQFTINAEGNMFTRTFRVQFIASPEVIEKWMADSPGLQGLEPDKSRSGFRRYQIVPGGGAQHAELEVDDNTHTVKIYVYWS